MSKVLLHLTYIPLMGFTAGPALQSSGPPRSCRPGLQWWARKRVFTGIWSEGQGLQEPHKMRDGGSLSNLGNLEDQLQGGSASAYPVRSVSPWPAAGFPGQALLLVE